MKKFEFYESDLSGVFIIEALNITDQRGFFSKTFEKDIFVKNGIFLDPYEQLQSFSHKGVIRGLHFQTKYMQDKLIRVVSGKVYDVVVDLRENSETFGKWIGFCLSSENRKMIYIPKGFAHGFLALDDNTELIYLCGDKYYPSYDSGILWNDKELDIHWPLHDIEKVIVSEKDSKLQTFDKFVTSIGALKIGE